MDGPETPQRLRVPSPSPFAPAIGFSAAVRAGDLVFVAGMTAVGADGAPVGGGDPYLQAREALRKVVEAVRAAGGDASDVVQTRMAITAPEHWEAVGRAHLETLGEAAPAATMLVTRLLDERMLVEIDAVARLGP